MTREELISAAQRACAAWWDSFGGSDDPDSEWAGLDDSERDYWCFIADRVLAASVELSTKADE